MVGLNVIVAGRAFAAINARPVLMYFMRDLWQRHY